MPDKHSAQKTPGMPVDGVQPRVGVYICHCGGNISDVVDVERVVEVVARLPDVVVARRNMFMCSDPGQKMIEDDIKQEKLNRVVVAACSPSLHEMTFRRVLTRAGLNPYLLENANLREQVSWVSKSDPAGATDKAIRIVGAAIAKAKLLRPLQPIRVDAHPRAAVIGGGIAGLRCALDLSQLNLKVTLVEQAHRLGGRLAELQELYPSREQAKELLDGLIRDVTADPNIEILTGATVNSAAGCVGDFHLTVRQKAAPSAKTLMETHHALGVNSDESAEARETEIHAGAIILATGFDHYRPAVGEYGYGEHPGVITLPEFNRLPAPDASTNGTFNHNGRPVRSIVFIHCVGSRQLDGVHKPGESGRLNHYCSRVCCSAALWSVNRLLERCPAVQVYDLYQDIRTYGRGHEDYYEDAGSNGTVFIRYDATSPPVVGRSGPDGQLLVNVKDTLTFNEELEVPADLIVLVTGMVPHAIDELAGLLKLPRSADGFLQEVHPKLRPVELSVGGVLIAGTCQAPMDSVEACASASAAASKAAAILGKGFIELDPFVATVDIDHCQGHGACVAECSYSNAVQLVEMELDGNVVKRAQVNAAICSGCGMCAAVCPAGAIQIEGWRSNQFEAMVDALIADYDKVV